MEKLSELSKPVAWEVKGILCHSEEEARIYVGEPEPLYSQEYVSALLAELEAKDQAHRVHAARLISERGVLRERVTELEAKLATPVRLTDERTLWAGEDDYDTGHVKGWNANRIEQAALLKKQGFTVAEDA
ncbi:hypothetical protein R3D73_005449 [Serratia marcescens]|nr:hypothetical protein [Serratia marcescens]ELQ9442522.1 hypothetical protein [Serratia marcescens]ELT5563283.1 hypothetical protein [Serratia marcescens]